MRAIELIDGIMAFEPSEDAKKKAAKYMAKTNALKAVVVVFGLATIVSIVLNTSVLLYISGGIFLACGGTTWYVEFAQKRWDEAGYSTDGEAEAAEAHR